MPNHSPSNDNAKFAIGQLIHHQLFAYHGVIADVDPVFQGSNSWHEQMARSRPPKDAPWYHVLVHDATQTTYVAEQNLAVDSSADPIRHPLIKEVFDGFKTGATLPGIGQIDRARASSTPNPKGIPWSPIPHASPPES